MRRPSAVLLAVFGLATSLACTRVHPAPSTDTGTPAAAALRDEILRADSAMFAAYNAHDAKALGAFFAKDLEFYHDTGGLLDWAQAMAGLTSNFDKGNGIRRDRVGRVEVYPVRDYGAIEVGAHRFCHREEGADVCGTFKFTHVWHRTATGWQVARAVSYDH